LLDRPQAGGYRMARAAGLDRNPIGSLFPKRDPNRYPPLTPGLSPVYAAIETTNCFNSFNFSKPLKRLPR